MYFDYAATTPLKECVKEKVISLLDEFGNPSSTHSIGGRTRHVIQESRKAVAEFINATADNIIFTSSGSASNTLGMQGYCKANSNVRLYYSAIAHKSAQVCGEMLGGLKIPVDNKGFIKLDILERMIVDNKKKSFVFIDYANSEIGTIQHVKPIIDLVHKYNGVCMLDCTGSISSIPVDVKKLDADLLSFSAHKLGSLKGCGVLYKKNSVQLAPLIYGSQENGLFAGTENVIGIAALGCAVKNHKYELVNTYQREYVYENLCKSLSDIYLIGDRIQRLPNHLCLCFQGVNSVMLYNMLDVNNIQVSVGSACNSGNTEPSPTLLAIDLPKEYLHSCIRITFSGFENISELKHLCNTIVKDVGILRSLKKENE